MVLSDVKASDPIESFALAAYVFKRPRPVQIGGFWVIEGEDWWSWQVGFWGKVVLWPAATSDKATAAINPPCLHTVEHHYDGNSYRRETVHVDGKESRRPERVQIGVEYNEGADRGPFIMEELRISQVERTGKFSRDIRDFDLASCRGARVYAR